MRCDTSKTNRSSVEIEILKATYDALLKHGYADLSVTRIGDELDKSKSVIYHHYDTKMDLLSALLDFAVDTFLSRIETHPNRGPTKKLNHFLERLLTSDPAEEFQLQAVLVCFRSQAVTDQKIRAQFTRIDQRLAATIQDIIARGIQKGVFCDVEVSQVSEHLLAVINGVISNRHTTDREGVATTAHASVVSYVESELKQSC
ncbi:TetR/AcrR family transcriptional regulator [Halorubrum sp. ASP1]|uniref:TetR/AcrR family transcriptional regulator n=1 Tax=Halorubrum sp. ASP1 TaxID=2518114 RepID=UPI0010F92D9F|nr:TetR/AcrR family transcriptional regulator [Halorubrum sp. ASP1]TKX63009.1 TetR/AcrR family transcriptional regulator [Halorubrum sp. ASP1]